MLTVFVVYLCLHLLAYFLVFRYLACFGKESMIFAFHALPALFFVIVQAIIALMTWSVIQLEILVFVISVHGIYSMTFLEFWSLTQGGYSLTILHRISKEKQFDVQYFCNVGNSKQENRLASLQNLGLVRCQKNGLIELTVFGCLVARIFQAIIMLVNVRNRG